jgi:hypothetical protein
VRFQSISPNCLGADIVRLIVDYANFHGGYSETDGRSPISVCIHKTSKKHNHVVIGLPIGKDNDAILRWIFYFQSTTTCHIQGFELQRWFQNDRNEWYEEDHDRDWTLAVRQNDIFDRRSELSKLISRLIWDHGRDWRTWPVGKKVGLSWEELAAGDKLKATLFNAIRRDDAKIL